LFESMIDARTDRKPSWQLATFVVALVLHVVVLTAILVQNYFVVPPITEPPIHVTFSHFTPPPAPPAAPPAPPKPAAPEPPKPEVQSAPPMPTEMVQPESTPEEIHTGPMPEPAVESAPGGVEGGVPGGVPGGAPAELPLPAGPLRVGGDVSAPVAISQTPPQYPSMARNSRVEGQVKLEAVIRRDGSVGDIRVVQGLRMGCTEAAIEALKHWRFKPGERNGVPVDVYYTLTVGFKLG
jgi:periplasmic protein TonB